MSGAEQLMQVWGGYLYLRDHDLAAVSRTSQLLRQGDSALLERRLHEEMLELAGVLNGEHRHTGLQEDVVLEGSQVCYWLFLYAIVEGITFTQLQPHHWLLAPAPPAGVPAIDALIRALLNVGEGKPGRVELTVRLQAILQVVGWCCLALETEPVAIIEVEMAQMKGRVSLEPYFRHWRV